MPENAVQPIGKAPQCRGDYKLGSACGRCKRCCEELLVLIAEFTDETPCHYDHDQFCQEHYHYRPCPHETAKHVLSTAKHRHGYEPEGLA